MSSRPPPPKAVGFVATGPGFYVWEETRSAALRAARDLSPRSAADPPVVPVEQRPGVPRRRRAPDGENDASGG